VRQSRQCACATTNIRQKIVIQSCQCSSASVRPHKKKLVYHPRPPPFSRPPQKKFIFYFKIFHHQNRPSCIKHAKLSLLSVSLKILILYPLLFPLAETLICSCFHFSWKTESPAQIKNTLFWALCQSIYVAMLAYNAKTSLIIFFYMLLCAYPALPGTWIPSGCYRIDIYHVHGKKRFSFITIHLISYSFLSFFDSFLVHFFWCWDAVCYC
jgi:hypothetical protein